MKHEVPMAEGVPDPFSDGDCVDKDRRRNLWRIHESSGKTIEIKAAHSCTASRLITRPAPTSANASNVKRRRSSSCSTHADSALLMVHPWERSVRAANWSTFSASGTGTCAVSTLVLMGTSRDRVLRLPPVSPNNCKPVAAGRRVFPAGPPFAFTPPRLLHAQGEASSPYLHLELLYGAFQVSREIGQT
jgi:hypothetical protein